MKLAVVTGNAAKTPAWRTLGGLLSAIGRIVSERLAKLGHAHTGSMRQAALDRKRQSRPLATASAASKPAIEITHLGGRAEPGC